MTDTTPLYIRVPVELVDDLRELAADEGRSMAKQAARMLREAIDRERVTKSLSPSPSAATKPK
ncbi:MAG TPA: hypothetical protein VGJ25_09185 [Gaiellaceae bacterium]